MNKENTVPALDLDQDKPNEQTIEEIVASLGDTVGDARVENPKMSVSNVDVFYADKQAIFGVDLDIANNEVISISLDGEGIYSKQTDPVLLRARVGMVFQKPNPFPKSIYENVAYGPRLHGLNRNKADLDDIVVNSLRKAGIFEEVKSRLDDPGTSLSGGQQQRLCIARTIACSPEVILMDEPCSALDPIATAKIEELIDELRENYAIAIVTHSMQQAATHRKLHNRSFWLDTNRHPFNTLYY